MPERTSIIILKPDKKPIRMYLPKERAADKQAALTYLHEIVEAEYKRKNPMHRLEQVMNLPKEILDKYYIHFEDLPDEFLLNLGGSNFMPYGTS